MIYNFLAYIEWCHAIGANFYESYPRLYQMFILYYLHLFCYKGAHYANIILTNINVLKIMPA